jgi:hypothetical protein
LSQNPPFDAELKCQAGLSNAFLQRANTNRAPLNHFGLTPSAESGALRRNNKTAAPKISKI